MSFAQETNTTLDNIKQAVKEAMQEIYEEDKVKDEQKKSELILEIKAVAGDWIGNAKKEKTSELNKLTHNNWEMLKEYISPVPYDYYLRNYTYTVAKADVFKADSLIVPYKGDIEIIEKLYLEQNHSTEASDVRPYQYTATRVIKINLEYRDNKFLVTGTTEGEASIKPGWQ